MHVLRWRLRATLVLALVAVSMPVSPALAIGTLDQEQPTIDSATIGGLAIGGSSQQKLGQTFTAGLTGTLTEIAVPVACDAGATLAVEIRNVAGGAPGATVLASTSVPATSLPQFFPATPAFRTISFASGAAVSAGTSYAFVLTAGDPGCGIFQGPVGDPYTQGDLYFDAPPNAPGWVCKCDFANARRDLPFRTYVEAAPSADLSILLTDSADPVLSSFTSYSYTAAVWNLGPSTPANAVVTFTLPSNLTYLSGTGCVAALPTVTCTVGALLPPDGSNTVKLATIQVQPNGGGTSATVSAAVSSELADPVAANNSATETTTITPVADLELVSLTGPATATVGDVVSFTATARNNSTHYAIPQSAIQISLPAGLTFQSISGSATATGCGPQSPPWPPACLFGPLAPGAQESATVTAMATSPGSYLILAETGNLGSIIEFDTANNAKSHAVTVSAPATADLSVTVTDSTDPAVIGSGYSYTVTVTSAGPATVDAQVSLALPSNLALTGAQAGCTLTSPVICTFAAIPSGATMSRTVFVNATSGTSATVTATVAGTLSDPDPANNVATETTTLTPPSADLSLLLTDSADPVLSSFTSYSYTAAVWNLGPSTPANVVVTFTLSPNLSYVGGNNCLATLPTVTCTVGTLLPPDGSNTVKLATINVQPNGGGTSATVSAVVSSELADPVSTNNSATETTTITPLADLELVSLTGPASATGGGVVTFTATARNNSTHYAIPQSGIQISIPAGLTFQSISSTPAATTCAYPSTSGHAGCLFGPLAPGAQESVTVNAVATTPGTYAIIAETFNLGSIIELDTTNNAKPASLTVTGETASGNLSTSTPVSTDSEGDGATAADPVETTVSAPGGPTGPVTITETPTTGTPPSGWSFFGQQIVITAPAASAMTPLQISFDIHGSVIPSGQTLSTIQVFRNGVAVGDCTAYGPIVPDPCVASRTTTVSGVRIFVYTSAASTWNLGFHLPFTFQGFRAPLDGQRTAVRAGSTVPIKFSLGSDQGMHVLAAAYTTTCGSTFRTNIAASALRYDAAEGHYIVNWRTDRSWSGCRELVLELTDGSSHRATLQFR